MQLYYMRSKVFPEFSPEEQKKYFSLKEKAVSHHVDTLYYSVFLTCDLAEEENSGLTQLLTELQGFKDSKLADRSETVLYYDMSVEAFGAAVGGGLYGYHLSFGEDFDIFFSSYIPGKDTPRIQVQLRTRSLVLDGLYGSLQKSFDKVTEILNDFDLKVAFTQENRIDYAFHTNAIQDVEKMFSEASLEKHLKTTFRDNFMHNELCSGKGKRLLEKDYCALGSRKSNNVFFRAYEKTKEVVQENYKGFFFEVWYQRGLISFYDKYVYELAYRLGAFKTGVLVGRIDFYLTYGHDAGLKEKLFHLLETCNIKSDNNPAIEEAIEGILPPVTKIVNVEYETKRKFYVNAADYIEQMQKSGNIVVNEASPLARLHLVLGLRREIITRLTTDIVRFVVDRKDPDSPPMAFWKRLSRVTVADQPSEERQHLYNTYARQIDADRARRRLCNALATVAYAETKDEDGDYGTDLWSFITDLNDNDIEEGAAQTIRGMSSTWYRQIRRRKVRQIKPLFGKKPRQTVLPQIDRGEDPDLDVEEFFEKRYEMEQHYKQIDADAKAKYEAVRKKRLKDEAHRRLAIQSAYLKGKTHK